MTLAGCNSVGVDLPSDSGKPGPSVPPASGPLVGETLGTGPVRVGMILPLTQNGGGPNPIGVSMRNAAQLAIDGFGAPYITLMIEDDHSSADAAAQAAQAELGAGAQLILGPVFANDVRSASAAAKSAGRPMIAFSTDVSVAAPGVYLLSFLIQGYVDRIIQYAVSTGKKSFAIMAPQNDYGNVAAERFQDMARKPQRASGRDRPLLGGPDGDARRSRWRRFRVRSTRCSFPSRPTPCPRSRALSRQPTSRPSSWEPASGTTRACSNCRRCRAPGSPRPTIPGFDAFAQRYKAKFNSDPARLATLAYDAVTLAAALARNGGPDPFNQAALTSVSGFNGADGVFRFRADGTNERGLAVMEIDDDAAQGDQPGAAKFRGGVRAFPFGRGLRRLSDPTGRLRDVRAV